MDGAQLYTETSLTNVYRYSNFDKNTLTHSAENVAICHAAIESICTMY